MKISTGKPPNNLFNRCREAFGVDWDRGIIFTYGDTVYCKYPITPDLEVHEGTHIKQQQELGKDVWWEKYFVDKDFRLSQEIEAYRNQLEYLRKNSNRQHRKFMEKHIIHSIITFYGGMCTEQEAKKLLSL